jgi:hypothetical protein
MSFTAPRDCSGSGECHHNRDLNLDDWSALRCVKGRIESHLLCRVTDANMQPFRGTVQSKIEIYQANATQCEARAREMPPTLRRDLLVLAENWRKLASKADEAEVKGGPKKQTNVN